jgi:hypothetical protein
MSVVRLCAGTRRGVAVAAQGVDLPEDEFQMSGEEVP